MKNLTIEQIAILCLALACIANSVHIMVLQHKFELLEEMQFDNLHDISEVCGIVSKLQKILSEKLNKD